MCDHLVASTRGRLLRAGPAGHVHAAHRVLSVEVEEDTGRAPAAARPRAGLPGCAPTGAGLLVALDDEATLRRRPGRAADLGLALVRMEQRRHRLEDLFRDEPPDARMTAGRSPAAGPRSSRA